MNKCFCCKKETSLELLKSDDFVDDGSRKFCPTCQQFSFNCHLCNKYYVCSRYKASSDEYFYNDDGLDNCLEDKEELEKDLYNISPAGEEYYYSEKIIANCNVCRKITCRSCMNRIMDIYTEDGDDFFCCKKCEKNKIPEFKLFSKFSFDDNNFKEKIYQNSLLLMESLIKEREEAKKLKKEIIKYKKDLLKTIVSGNNC
jgi:hypothetical protein